MSGGKRILKNRECHKKGSNPTSNYSSSGYNSSRSKEHKQSEFLRLKRTDCLQALSNPIFKFIKGH